MPTYTESLFEPLEAWLEKLEAVAAEVDYPYLEERKNELRLITTRMLLEHAGRARVGFVPEVDQTRPPAIDRLDTAIDELVAELRAHRINAESDRRGAGAS